MLDSHRLAKVSLAKSILRGRRRSSPNSAGAAVVARQAHWVADLTRHGIGKNPSLAHVRTRHQVDYSSGEGGEAGVTLLPHGTRRQKDKDSTPP